MRRQIIDGSPKSHSKLFFGGGNTGKLAELTPCAHGKECGTGQAPCYAVKRTVYPVRMHSTVGRSQLSASATLEWASSQGRLCQLSAHGILRRLCALCLRCAVTAQCVLCLRSARAGLKWAFSHEEWCKF